MPDELERFAADKEIPVEVAEPQPSADTQADLETAAAALAEATNRLNRLRSDRREARQARDPELEAAASDALAADADYQRAREAHRQARRAQRAADREAAQAAQALEDDAAAARRAEREARREEQRRQAEVVSQRSRELHQARLEAPRLPPEALRLPGEPDRRVLAEEDLGHLDALADALLDVLGDVPPGWRGRTAAEFNNPNLRRTLRELAARFAVDARDLVDSAARAIE